MELGTWADWVSGIGSLAASGVALFIAFRQESVAKRKERIAEGERIASVARVKEEAIRILADLEAQGARFSQLVDFGGGQSGTAIRDAKEELDGLRSQLSTLQAFPGLPPRVIAEIGRAIHDSRLNESDLAHSPSSLGFQMREIAERMKKRREAIVEAQLSVL